MQTLIVKTDSAANANFLATFLRTHTMVRSVSVEPDADSQNMANEPAGEYNWTNPSRPATDEEFEQMISECEAEYKAGLGMPVEKARALTKKKFAEWRKQNRK